MSVKMSFRSSIANIVPRRRGTVFENCKCSTNARFAKMAAAGAACRRHETTKRHDRRKAKAGDRLDVSPAPCRPSTSNLHARPPETCLQISDRRVGFDIAAQPLQ